MSLESRQISVLKVPWNTHKTALQSIREQVFIIEQRVPKTLEWDGQDETSTHFMAINNDGDYLGCARLLPTGQIGRMAVLKKHRAQGIGASLLTAAIREGHRLGLDPLFLHAQRYAEAFYERGGFVAYGDTFEEAGIEHVAMRRVAAGPQAPSLSNLDQCRESLLQVVKATRRRLLIYSPDLVRELIDQPSMVDALSEFVRSAPQAHLSIGILDIKQVVNRDHSLLALAQRLDEKIKIRVFPQAPGALATCFVCGDQTRQWQLSESYQGSFGLNTPAIAERLAKDFDQRWHQGKEARELRLLHL